MHDTQLCAWWAEPCDDAVFSQDLCRRHYNHAWHTGQRAPTFVVVRSLREHRLTRPDDDARTVTCSICGPATRFRWTTTGGRGAGRRRTCGGAGGASQRRADTGWSPEQYDHAVIAQGNRCAICGHPPMGRGRHGVLQADHSHATRQRRQLLCGQCNHLLGLANDDPDTLRRAAEYLTQHAEVPVSA